ncbi:hypothetical protein ACKKBF_B40215 [Auxenochlorella protothecoides x Auxenochlorella symbiontica]
MPWPWYERHDAQLVRSRRGRLASSGLPQDGLTRNIQGRSRRKVPSNPTRNCRRRVESIVWKRIPCRDSVHIGEPSTSRPGTSSDQASCDSSPDEEPPERSGKEIPRNPRTR